jgi:hypothetical protein
MNCSSFKIDNLQIDVEYRGSHSLRGTTRHTDRSFGVPFALFPSRSAKRTVERHLLHVGLVYVY